MIVDCKDTLDFNEQAGITIEIPETPSRVIVEIIEGDVFDRYTINVYETKNFWFFTTKSELF